LYKKAEQHLSSADPEMKKLMARFGPCRLGGSGYGQGFSALVRAIISQQLSSKAAAAISKRVLALCGDEGFTSGHILKLSQSALREAGLSRAKVAYLKDLSMRLDTGELDLSSLKEKDDDGVTSELTQIKGIGQWTADMYLIFALGRMDVFPIGDAAVLSAINALYAKDGGKGGKKDPIKRALRLSEKWRPYRSIASWYLWEYVDSGGIPD
jgi:DNA-3-methyladenine glycosylase II